MAYESRYKITLDMVLSENNVSRALKIMKFKKPSPGLDGISAGELEDYWKTNRKYVMSSIRSGTYTPEMLKLYFRKKPGKKDKRKIAICTLMDQMIQHCIRMEVERYFIPTFHKDSFGFIKGKNTFTALDRCLYYMNAGWDVVVDADIRKFFDSVKHKIIIKKLSEATEDGMLIELVSKYLKNPGVAYGRVYHNRIGLPQGSSFSPVFANVVLNELDWYFAHIGIKFLRYADDLLLFCKTKAEAERNLECLSRYLANKLSLSLNMEKTSICPGSELEFLGYAFSIEDGKYRLDLNEKLISKMMEKLEKHLRFNKNQDDFFNVLGGFNRGWVNYYFRAEVEKLKLSENKADKLTFNTLCNNSYLNSYIWRRLAENKSFTTMSLWDEFLRERREHHE
jgi:group II intron reverse transcriptase/maturase